MDADEVRIWGGIFGTAVGDALGATVEFCSRDEIRRRIGVHREMRGGGWLHVQPGEWTDDTAMMLCVAEGILESPENPVPAIGRRFLEWYRGGPPDVGYTVRAAIEAFVELGDWPRAAQAAAEKLRGRAAGNGCLMRTLPVGIAYRGPARWEMTARIARMTHWDRKAEIACIFCTHWAEKLLDGEDKETSFNDTVTEVSQQHVEANRELEFFQALSGAMAKDPSEIRASGFVFDTLLAAAWAFLESESFEDAVVRAVNLGDDADTTGAVAGGLAGLYYGYEAIPDRWLEPLAGKDRLEAAASGLSARFRLLRHDAQRAP